MFSVPTPASIPIPANASIPTPTNAFALAHVIETDSSSRLLREVLSLSSDKFETLVNCDGFWPSCLSHRLQSTLCFARP